MTHIKDHRKIHLIGMGGCSMSGLAMLLSHRGYAVQGSDCASSPFTERLAELNIPCAIGHSPENLGDADLVIYSAAIKPENPERAVARERGIPELERSVALGQLSEGYDKVLGISGCHGKTTITSMLALISEQGDLNATVHVGGYVEALKGGIRLGGHGLFITEACEYVESFLTLRPTTVVLNNIDNDHLDYYKTMDNIVTAFKKFIALLPEDGLLIACAEDWRVMELFGAYPGPKLSYGLSGADYTPAALEYDEAGCASFTLAFHGEALGRITLHVPGQHAVIDALAAAAAALSLGESFENVAKGLSAFRNARRRFEYYGRHRGMAVYHDYAHHPAEVKAALDAARRVAKGRVWCLFQCNSYTRAKTLFTGCVTCFTGADTVLIPDIFPGRETDDGSVHARDMAAAIEAGGSRAVYIPTFEGIREYLDENGAEGDVILTLGSGDVYRQTLKLFAAGECCGGA